jgi:hypothetical protein
LLTKTTPNNIAIGTFVYKQGKTAFSWSHFSSMCCLLFVLLSENDQHIVGAGVMSTLKSPGLMTNHGAFEVDMRNLLRGKRENGSAEASTESEERNVELASMISQISFQAIEEVDYLISGLQGIRHKLDDDRDRIQREIGQHVSFSQSIVDLTNIVSDGMTAIKTMAPEVIELPRERGGSDA